MKISVKIKDVEIHVDDQCDKSVTHAPYNDEVIKLIKSISDECVKLFNLKKND